MEEERPRRRRRRRGRRRREGEAAPGATREPALPVEWRWRTFPVFFAFAAGALSMAVLTTLAPGAFPVWLIAALFGVAFGLAHIFARSVVVGRRRR